MTTGCGVLVEAEEELRKLSPRDAYIGFCLRQGCKPILAIADLFSNVAGDWDSDEVIDLSRTYVGPHGVLAVCEVCKLLKRLRHLDFSNNFLTNECGPSLASLLSTHPTLQSLELQGNRFVSWTAAMYLTKAVAESGHVTYVGLLGTSTDKDTRDTLFALTRRNAVNLFAKRGACAQPSHHHNAVLLRAMRQYFLTFADEEGNVPAFRVQDGRRERRLFDGLNSGGGSTPPKDDEDGTECGAAGNATDELITWNQFLVLVMLDGCVYDKTLVDRLFGVFERFNVLPNGGRGDGLVEVHDFPHVLNEICAVPAPSRDVAVLKSKLGLDDTMTICWDEFLYTFYHCPSDMSNGITSCVATPLPTQLRALHY